MFEYWCKQAPCVHCEFAVGDKNEIVTELTDCSDISDALGIFQYIYQQNVDFKSNLCRNVVKNVRVGEYFDNSEFAN